MYCATTSSGFSYSTGYSTNMPWFLHSTTPMRHARSSLPARSVKGSVLTKARRARVSLVAMVAGLWLGWARPGASGGARRTGIAR